MCYYYAIIAKPPFTKPPFVNSRGYRTYVRQLRQGVRSNGNIDFDNLRMEAIYERLPVNKY